MTSRRSEKINSERDNPPRPAVADDLSTTVLIPLLVTRDVVGYLGFESLGEHPPGPLASDLIQSRAVARVRIAALNLDEVGHSAESSVGEILRTDTRCHRGVSGNRPPIHNFR